MRPASSWLPGLLLIAATLAAYFPCWNGSFVWDDDAWTTNLEPLFRDLSGLGRIWTDPTAMQQYYPLTGTTFWIDHQLWGQWTLPYHLENILLHACSAILFWRLLHRLEVPGAALAGAVFALHPMMAESVAWITERKNVLSLVLFLGALLAYGRFESFWEVNSSRRNWLAYACSLGLFLGALLSKITAFALPPTILLLVWWKRGRIRWKEDVLPTLPFFALTLALGLHTEWLERHHVGAEGSDFAATPTERLIIAGWSFWFYPWKLLWPANLCFVYPKWEVHTGSVWQWLAPVSAVLALAALWLSRSRMGRGPVVAVLFYVGSLFPVMGFMNAYGGLFSHVWDHWVYVPSLGLIAVGAAGMTRLVDGLHRPGIFPAIVLAAPLALGAITWRQAAQYRDPETLWSETIRRNPACWLAHNNHGAALAGEGRLDEAMAHYEQALAANPRHAEAHNNMGYALLQKGRAEAAIAHYQEAVKIRPGSASFRLGLGNALLMNGRWKEAAAAFQEALSLLAGYPEAHNGLGTALLRQDRLDEATAHFKSAIDEDPRYHQAYNNMASALLAKGDTDGALANYEKALAIKPDFAEARYNLGNLLYKKGDIEGAITCYRKVLSDQPRHPEAEYNLGLALATLGRTEEAVAEYRKAIEIRPDHANAQNNLGNLLLELGRPAEALPHFREAIAADPHQVAALNNLAWVLATSPDNSLRDGAKALEFAREAVRVGGAEQPVLLTTLAAACAEAGRFEEALMNARHALELASAQGNSALAANIAEHLKLYEAGRAIGTGSSGK